MYAVTLHPNLKGSVIGHTTRNPDDVIVIAVPVLQLLQIVVCRAYQQQKSFCTTNTDNPHKANNSTVIATTCSAYSQKKGMTKNQEKMHEKAKIATVWAPVK